MNKPIMITPQELIAIILAICGAIITVSGAITVIARAVNKAKEPENKQNERISNLEEEVKKINSRLEDGDKRFDEDAGRFDELEASMKKTNTVIIRSLNAIISHSINGNSVESLKKSKEELDEYLLNK